jgi:hypothetical protein
VGPSEEQRLLKKMHLVEQALSLDWKWLQKNVTLFLAFFIMPRIFCITRMSYACIPITVLATFETVCQHEGTVMQKSDKSTLVNIYGPKMCYLYHFIS